MGTQAQQPATEEREVEILSNGTGTLDRLTKAEIDIQISTAHAYPRSITKSLRDLTSMVTLDAFTAEKCFYSLKRRDKDGKDVRIEGASVRFAELAASAWGNMRASKRIADEDDHFIYGQGAAHDLESNNAIALEVSRRITGKSGKRYGDDMIGVTGNAAASIAYRNAVLAVIPRALWWPIYEKAKLTARGTMETLAERRKNAIAEFKKINVDQKMIFDYLGVKGVEDIGLDQLMDLIGAFNAIKNGDATVENTFGEPAPQQPKRKGETEAAAAGKAEEVKQQPAEAATTATAQEAETQKPKGELISPEAIQRVYAEGIKVGWSANDVKVYLARNYSVNSVAELRADQVTTLIEELKNGGKPPAEQKA